MRLPGLATENLGRHVLCLSETPSTNLCCWEHADTLPHGAAVLARRQTRGRGRLGRSWSGGDGRSLMFSVLLRQQRVEELPLLTLVTGLGVARGLERLCAGPFSLKWSNDVLHEGGKVCGILCESRISGADALAVLGIGVNVLQTQEEFRRLNLVYARSLYMATGKKMEISAVCAAILNELEPVLQIFGREGFSFLLPEYKKRCVTLGRQVRVEVGGETITGTALDVAEDGSLICETGAGLRRIYAGEASVRGLYGYAE